MKTSPTILNWGTLGDALVEMGDYDGAAEPIKRWSACGGSGQLQSSRLVPFPLGRHARRDRHHGKSDQRGQPFVGKHRLVSVELGIYI